jgi:hypothetical protein
MMQKNEDALLLNWLKYYGYLFGFENLVVLDNGSDSETSRDILQRFAAAGVRVIYRYNGVIDFHRKGSIIAELIRQMEDEGDDSDFYLPVDCDEFITVFEDANLSCSRAAIHRMLDSLINSQAALSINSSFYNLPGEPGWFCAKFYEKGLVERRTLLDLDHGFHYPKTIYPDRRIVTKFAYLHFHNKPLSLLLAHARQKFAGFVDPDDPVALAAWNGTMVHMKKYFSMTEEDYARRYDGELQVYVPEIGYLAQALGLVGPAFEFPPLRSAGCVALAADGNPEARQNAQPFRIEDVPADDEVVSYNTSRLARFIQARHRHVDQ